jgi:AcrR family transcriptional regulator
MTTKTTSTLSSHDRILLAAKRLFAENGYENTSTVAIARDAGTSESQLMKHFGSKQGLLVAIFDRGCLQPTVCWLFSRPLQLNWNTILIRRP